MCFLTAHLVAVLLGVAMVEDLDRLGLIQLIDTARQSSYRDISFDYEGKDFVPGPIERQSLQLGEDGISDVFTGTFRRRSDGAISLDIFDVESRLGKQRAHHSQIALLNDQMEISTLAAAEKQAKISVENPDLIFFAGSTSYRNVWLNDWVRMFAQSQYLYDFLGTEQLDGRQCLVVRFRLVYDESLPRDKQGSHTFWMDFQRGGHVVRHEKRFGGKLIILGTARLGEFTVKPGQIAWLPISGRVESRAAWRDGKGKYLDEPVHYETYEMIPATIRFNQGLQDSAFSVNAKLGDAVSDQIRKARYEFGQYMVRPREVPKVSSNAEIKANLDKMLGDSKIMSQELKATSPMREGPTWWSRWPWVLAVTALAGVGFVWFRQRKV